LVGNVGGYIGLCLGYNFLQIPGLILILSRKLKIFYSGKESKTDGIEITTSDGDMLESKLKDMPR
jgi:hypothetical protein